MTRANNLAHLCLIVSLAWVLLLPHIARADATTLQPARLFRDRMVLQRDIPAPVWGWYDPGKTVTVAIAGQTKTVETDAAGQWLVRLDPLPAGGPHTLTIAADTTITIEDVLVGDVWLATGQSNMVFGVSGMEGAAEVLTDAHDDGICLFEVERFVSPNPQRDVAGGAWAPGADSRYVGRFSAVGYTFARKVHRDTGVPIGIITCAVGATMVEHWMSPDALASQPDFADDVNRRYRAFLDNWKDSADYPDFENNIEAHYKKAYAEMIRINRLSANLKKEGKEMPQAEHDAYARAKSAWKVYKYVPSGLYNAMLKPLIPYGIRGVLWYQGESNDDLPDIYARQLPCMIQSWRDEWQQGDFPFYIVSLAAFRAEPETPNDPLWPRVREVQWNTQHKLPNVATTLAIDVGDASDIHPKRKRQVGERLALIALAKVYDKDVAYSGPVFRAMKVSGNAVHLTFDHADGLTTSDDKPPRTFAVAGEDRVWHWATARIDGNSVVLTCDAVAQPVAVRYAWADNPPVNLYNAANLPAAPFRTDDWPRP